MEAYFLITNIEELYDINELVYEDALYEYVQEVLQIPSENISTLNFSKDGIELVLNDLTYEDIKEDWFLNLQRESFI